MREGIEKFGFLKGIGLLFIIGFVMGIGIFLGLKEYFAEYTNVFYDTLITNLSLYEIKTGRLLQNILFKEFRSFFLMLLFGISILGIPYLIAFLIYRGFAGGVLLGSILIKFGGKGILLGILYGFPQFIFYIPVMVALIHKNYYMGMQGLKKKLFWEQVPSFFILAGIFLLGCLSEAYVNSWILKKILLWL